MGIESIPCRRTALLWTVCAFLAFAAAGTVSAGGYAGAPPIELPAGKAFKTKQTNHFVIWYDTPYNALRPLVNRVEGTYLAVVRVGRAFGFPMDDPKEPLFVVLAADHSDFVALAKRVQVDGNAAAGFYDPGANVSIFGDVLTSPSLKPLTREIDRLSKRLKQARQGKQGAGVRERVRAWSSELGRLTVQRDAIVKRFNRVVIQHEAAHHILFNLGVHRRGADNPIWVVEGLAMQFEVPQTSIRGRIRAINQLRLGDLRKAAGLPPAVHGVSDDAYRTAFAPNGLIPLTKLISGDPLVGASAERTTTVYAQSWGLVYYLARTQEAALGDYLRALAARGVGANVAPAEELAQFGKAFGVPNEAFQRRWLEYMAQLRFKPEG